MLQSKTALLNSLIQSYTSQFKQPPGDIYESRFSKTQDLLENGKIVQIPVRTRDCNNHEKWSFDLFDIYQQSEVQYQQCGICNAKFTKDTLILDNYWYSFIRQFNKKCQYIVILKDMCYQKKIIRIMFIHFMREEMVRIIFSRVFKQDRFLDQEINEFQYQTVCLQDQVKLYLPVRFNDCKHIAAYELSSLLCHFSEVIGLLKKAELEKSNNNQQFQQKLQIKKVYQCRQPGCNVKINYDLNELKQNLVLDNELLDIIKLAHPSAINFQLKNNRGVIQVEHEFSNGKNQLIENLWQKIPKETQHLYPSQLTDKIRVTNSFAEFFSSILEIFQRIFSNQDEEKVLKAILQKFKYQTYEISLYDNVANQVIEYPARCTKCDGSKCLDLRTLISNLLNQKKSEPQKLGLICPICNFNHMDTKPRQSINILNTQNIILYLDNQLLAQMIRNNSYKNLYNNIMQYDGKKIMLEEYTRNQVITIEQTREQSTYNNGIIQYLSMKCNGTNNLLKDPLILVKCPTQNRFSFDFVYEVFKNSGFVSNGLKLCKCEVCNQSTQDIQDLYYDEFLANIIPQLPKNYDLALPIKYDTQKGQFIFNQQEKQVENIEFIPLIAQNKGFIDMKDDEEYQKLFEPVFVEDHQMQITEVVIQVGGFKITRTRKGITKTGGEEELKRIKKLAEDYAKWGLQVNNVDVKQIKKN
ncbi:hypothetical protein pb186bvf_004495 [Paramecium bursaria]